MDLMKWLPLWEKCPELRPEGILRTGDEHGRWRLGFNIPTSKPVIVGNAVASALIRDKAVWWLAATVDNELYLFQTDTGFSVFADNHDIDSSDPTEALYLACCKVLGIEA